MNKIYIDLDRRVITVRYDGHFHHISMTKNSSIANIVGWLVKNINLIIGDKDVSRSDDRGSPGTFNGA